MLKKSQITFCLLSKHSALLGLTIEVRNGGDQKVLLVGEADTTCVRLLLPRQQIKESYYSNKFHVIKRSKENFACLYTVC